MEEEIKKVDKTYYTCEICKFTYEDKEWDEKCQAWCDEHQPCNMEITKHAVS